MFLVKKINSKWVKVLSVQTGTVSLLRQGNKEEKSSKTLLQIEILD